MATGIAFPTVPEGKARIRAILTSEHTRAQLDQALETIERVAKRMGILDRSRIVPTTRHLERRDEFDCLELVAGDCWDLGKPCWSCSSV